jgi:type I restriction enzyme S subunit
MRLDVERQRVDSLAETELRSIRLLQERRQALITAAVTGQLDIPAAA